MRALVCQLPQLFLWKFFQLQISARARQLRKSFPLSVKALGKKSELCPSNSFCKSRLSQQQPNLLFLFFCWKLCGAAEQSSGPSQQLFQMKTILRRACAFLFQQQQQALL